MMIDSSTVFPNSMENLSLFSQHRDTRVQFSGLLLPLKTDLLYDSSCNASHDIKKPLSEEKSGAKQFIQFISSPIVVMSNSLRMCKASSKNVICSSKITQILLEASASNPLGDVPRLTVLSFSRWSSFFFIADEPEIRKQLSILVAYPFCVWLKAIVIGVSSHYE